LKTIYYVRHGQTELNAAKRVQGRINSDLTALGQMQAYITGQYFSDQQIHFDAVYRSPLERCKDTAMLICPYKQAVAMDGFIETGYGKLEGSSVDEFQKVKGKYSNSAFVKKFGGEDLEDVAIRGREAFRKVLEETADDATILIIGHGSAGFHLAQSFDRNRARAMRKFGNCLIYTYHAENTLDSVVLESIELGPAALLDPERFQ